ncbi:hypothetical protein PpBr36_07891 [Pyricularia pennisetigena]|uniref:hypothetical protein n=1 Tax=Pyricularia pennisetigena TaxID=1578925 RepID=UPI00115195DB|nr:hypothetical protein PpBr36_07891 [Pyricularia pennisetigena]TLS25283.1 hypothetical protein PpBr36_07891 [Pyricularia pennisetigena]
MSITWKVLAQSVFIQPWRGLEEAGKLTPALHDLVMAILRGAALGLQYCGRGKADHGGDSGENGSDSHFEMVDE